MSARGACASLLRGVAGARGSALVRVGARCSVGPPTSSLLLVLRGAHAHSLHRVCLSTQSAGASAANAEASPKGGAEGAKAGADASKGQRAAADELPFEDYEMEEPFVAKASRIVWTTIKLAAGVAFLGGLVYAGYTIVTTLVPVGDSPNAIMRKATDILSHDPDVHAYYGVVKTYGLDPGGRAEGRRYFVPEYKYEDNLSGDKYHRVKFTLEGERNRKAWVYGEVGSSTGDFRYLLVVAKDGSRVVSVIDRRPPPLSQEDRVSRVTTLLQDAAGEGWAFYADNDVDARAQAAVLGEYWLKVKCVRCDETAERCVEAGVVTTPAWKTGSALVKGVKSLDELEKLVQPLAQAKEGGGKKGLFW